MDDCEIEFFGLSGGVFVERKAKCLKPNQKAEQGSNTPISIPRLIICVSLRVWGLCGDTIATIRNAPV